MSKERRQHSNEFKAKVVARIVEGKEAYQAVADDVGVVHSVIRRWVRQSQGAAKAARKEAKKTAKPKGGRPKGMKNKQPTVVSGGVREATILLKHARHAAIVNIKKNPALWEDEVYSLARSALRALSGV